MFKCNKCGLCCRNLDRSEIYKALHNGDGICINLDEKNNKCRIYDSRPEICNVDLMYDKYFSNTCLKEEYYDLNYYGCYLLSNEKNNNIEHINSTTIGTMLKELTQRHGEAASQMIQVLKGKRYDSNGSEIFHIGRNLKDISNYKVNPENRYANLKQQAGFSAELVKEARDNKEAILNNDTTRTRTTDGIGKINDQFHDHVKIDEKNNIISGSESQMKFKGKFSNEREIAESSKNIVNDMVSSKWEKYSESYMDIPSEQVEEAKKYAREQAEKNRGLAEEYRRNGDIKKSEEFEQKAEKYEKAEGHIRDSGVSSSEAMEARKNPEKFTAKEILSDSIDSGIEAAKGAAMLGLAVSSAQNLYCVLKNEKTLDDAVADIVVSTGQSSIKGFVIGSGGTALKASMHSSKRQAIRLMGKTNAPAMMISAALEVGNSLTKYARCEINEEELLEELGEKGTGMVAASYGAAVGTAFIPGIGTIIGGMIGYTVSGLLYKESLATLKNERISAERRRIIESINEQAIAEMAKYSEELEKQRKSEYMRREKLFIDFFEDIEKSILSNDIDSLFENINSLGCEFNADLQFNDFKEFDDFMSNDEGILIL